MAKFFHLVFHSLLILTASATSQAGELYQWVDEDGVITYSPEPPPAEVTREYREISGELSSSSNQQSTQKAVTKGWESLDSEPSSLTASTRVEPIGFMENESRIERMARLAPKPIQHTTLPDSSVQSKSVPAHNAPLDLGRIRLNRKCSDLNNRISALETRLTSVESAAELNQSMLLLAKFQTMHENSCEREGF